MESFMDNDQVPPNNNSVKRVSHHVSGMPTISELKRRVLVRQLEKQEKEDKRARKAARGARKKQAV